MDKRLIPIGLLNLVNILGFAIMIPVLPFVVEEYGGTAITYGFLLALYPAFQFIGSPILGTLSDRHGRRPLLLFSQAGTLLSWVVFGVAYFLPNIQLLGVISLPLLVIGIARVIDGVTGGNFSVANAYISDITPSERKTKVFGLLGAIMGVGLIIGPVLGGYLNSLPAGYLSVVIFSFLLSLITLILMHLYLPETLDPGQRNLHARIKLLAQINIWAKINSFRSIPGMRRLFLIRLFFSLAFTAYTSTIVLLMKDQLQLSSAHIGSLFLIFGTYLIINQSLVVPRIAHRIGNLRTFYFGQVCFALGLLGLTQVTNVSQLVLVIYLANLGFSASFPTFKSIITDLVDNQRQGEITGLDEAILAGASAVAPLLASFAYATFQQTAYALFASFLILPYLVIYIARKKLATKSSPDAVPT